MTKVAITKRGNAVGFTNDGLTVTGYYRTNAKAWRIAVCNDITERMNDDRCQTFATKPEAERYAATLIDEARTEELRWW